MVSDLQFRFEGSDVRVVFGADGAPWWIGRDVCAVLGISNVSDALSGLAGDERRDGVGITDPIGRTQHAVAVNEPGLYRLIFQSRKPAAERFKRWLAHDVLPVLRRTGSYTPARVADDPGFLPADTDEWLSLVREARMTFGRAAARRLWRRSPLPEIASDSDELDPTERYCSEFLEQCCDVTGQGSDFVRSRDLINAAINWRSLGWPGERSFSNAMLRLARASSDDFGVLMFWQAKRSHAGFRGLKLK
jgi:prophage antirepressor-like protein